MSNDTLPYQVTTEPLQEPDFPAEIAHEHEALFYGAQEGRSSALHRLRELVKRYPRVREFQSWLYSGYRLQDRKQEAKKVLDQMLKDHPDYLFARLNQAGLHLDKEQTEPVLKLLGQNLELTDLYPDRTRFHLSEALSFEYESARYFLTTGNLPAAEERYRRLRLIAPDDQAAKNIGAQLAMARMRRNLANLIEKQIPPQEVDSHPTYTPESWTERPSFRHPETEQLYHYGVDLPEAIVEAMLALPRDSFIADLELVLEDAIRRYETIRAGDPESEEDFDFLTFPIHAVRFLGALEAEASLPAVLNLFRQGEERLSFWFGDMMLHYTRDSLYRIAQNQLDALRDFALEPHLFYEPRSIASEVAALVALHQPERRAEVLDWYRAVYDRLLAHPDDETRIDTYFINTLNGDLLDIRAVELAPYLNRVAEAGWLDPTSAGSLEEMLAELESPIEEHRKNPLPESPVEVFTRDHWNRHREKMFQGGKLELPEPDDAFRDFLELMGRRGEPDQAIPEEEEEDDEYYPRHTPPQTVKRSQPKVGRNDPCPCGSGKKYKKCCGKP